MNANAFLKPCLVKIKIMLIGLIIDSRCTFEEHLKMIRSKTNQIIGLLRNIRKRLPRSALLSIYKAFVRPHLDYRYIICDEACNASFH